MSEVAGPWDHAHAMDCCPMSLSWSRAMLIGLSRQYCKEVLERFNTTFTFMNLASDMRSSRWSRQLVLDPAPPPDCVGSCGGCV